MLQILRLLCLLAIVLAMQSVSWQTSHAQTLPLAGNKTAVAPDGDEALKQLLESAKTAGSRIIIIEPDSQGDVPVADAMTMTSVFSGPSLLEARKRMIEMVVATVEYYSTLPQRLTRMGEDGTLWWVVRAVATATAGILLGKYFFGLFGQWVRRNLDESVFSKKRLAGKLGEILLRAVRMLVGLALCFVTAIIVAVIFDSGHQPTRDFVWIVITSYVGYRIIRSVVFWNFFSPDIPNQRMINLGNERSKKLFTHWGMVLFVFAILAGFCRFLVTTNSDPLAQSEVVGSAVRVSIVACLVVSALLLAILTISHRRDTYSIVVGAGDPDHKPRWRKFIAAAVTPALLIYIVVALIVSSLRLILGAEGGLVPLTAPLIIFIFAIFAYGFAIFVLEIIYQRLELNFYRRRRNQALSEARARRREIDSRRLALGMDDEDERLIDGEEMQVHLADPGKLRHKKYFPAFEPFFTSVIQATVLVVSIGETFRLWGYDLGREGGHPITSALDTLLALVIALGAYRAFNQFIDYKIVEEGGTLDTDDVNPGEGDGEGGKGQSRLATLLPIFRNVLVSVIAAVSVVVVLSNLGVDVAPLFAGAGVVGIAIGFGAQTLIRDIFSGTFFLIDDAFRKGEYIEIDDIRGIVEKISMRSFQLRHHLGAVHTIPFGEIKRITNYSRDWVMMKLPLRLPYDTDVERVRKMIKKLGQQLLEDESIGQYFLQPLKSQGVYAMEDSAMIVRVKFMTRPGDQFITRKAVYAAIRELFEREGIKFAHREVTVRLADDQKDRALTEEEKKAVSGAVREVVESEVVPTGKQKASAMDDM